jgi:FkbM family methyltransferase
MNIIKKMLPGKLKQAARYFLYDIFKVPYSRYGVPLAILKWLPNVSDSITFIDVGASVGHFTQNLTQTYKIKRAILVEPLTQYIPLLKDKFTPDHFEIINAALAETPGEADFYINDEFDSISSLLKIDKDMDALVSLKISEPRVTKVKTLTLDAIFNDLQLKKVDLIKIDVQGAEHLVLKGGAETLKNTRLVYTEFSFKPLYQGSSTFFDLYQIMEASNFILVSINEGYASDQGELLQGDAKFLNKLWTV